MPSTNFTNRIGGGSLPPYGTNNLAFHVGDDPTAVQTNRTALASSLGSVIYMNQSHSDQVVVVDGSLINEVNADALVTQQSDIALAVLVADCIPLLLWDEERMCVAAVHVGRGGLMNEIALKTLAVMRAMGGVEISALLGPSICGKCYEVGEEIHVEVCAVHPLADSRTRSGSLSLDLPKALAGQLSAQGVTVKQSSECTVENLEFFSYRRDGITGRQAGVIRL